MNILDFTTSKRAYMLYNYFKDKSNYNYTIIPSYKSDIPDIEKYCPEVVPKITTVDDIRHSDFDVIILHTCSILYRKYNEKLINILNEFRGKIFCVDYAWEGALHKRKQTNLKFKNKISGMGIAIRDSCTDIPVFAYSQPGLDVFAHTDRFRTKEDIIDSYGLPKGVVYILITTRPDFYKSKNKNRFSAFVKKDLDLDNVCIIWKMKDDHGRFYKVAKKYLKKRFPYYKIVTKQPHNKSGVKTFRDFISPVNELCLIADCHINISPLSYAQIETVRAGVPTYFFNKSGISFIDYVDEFKRTIFADESFKRYSVFRAEKSRCRLKVPNNYCTANFMRNIEREIND